MKILVISTPIFRLPISGYGGLEQIAWQCAAGLAARGHSVALVAPDDSVCPGVEIVPVGPAGRVDERGAYARYSGILDQFDVIISHEWQKHAYLAKAAGRIKAPVLGVLHAPVNTMYQTLPPVEKPCFVCISEDQRSHFEALFEQPARVARNGIDLDFYRPLGLERTDRFLFLARFSTIKGPHLAIAAASRVGVGLDLIGDTTITGEPDYLKECQALADGKRVVIHGGKSRGECVWWMSRAYAFCHPNKTFREPLGLAPLEAMACGLPVIAWRRGALKETVLENETGWLVSSEEELEQALRRVASEGVSPATRSRCWAWVESQFGIAGMVNRYAELCEEAVQTGGW